MKENAHTPIVSVIIVVRNGESYIVNCIDSIIKQFTTEDQWELIIVDGLSTDKTILLAKSYLRHKNVSYQFIDNPKLILSSGWNIGLQAARGDYVVRVDTHAVLLPEYIKNGLNKLDINSQLVGVGGFLITKSDSKIGQLIATILSNPIGVGRSLFRIGVKKDTYTSTAVYAVYRKSVLIEIGGLDESLVRNQDINLHDRLLKKDYLLMTAANMKAEYYSRASIYKFLLQGWQNGLWVVKNKKMRVNHLVPLMFCISIFISLFLGWRVLCALLTLYMFAVILSYIHFSKVYNFSKLIVLFGLTFALHISYGVGSMYGFIRSIF